MKRALLPQRAEQRAARGSGVGRGAPGSGVPSQECSLYVKQMSYPFHVKFFIFVLVGSKQECLLLHMKFCAVLLFMFGDWFLSSTTLSCLFNGYLVFRYMYVP